MTEAKILRIRDVEARIALKKSAIYEMIQRGEFPKAIKLGPRAVGWRVADVDEWIASRPAAA